jgi:diacylglycerol kinase (ATP)
MPTIHKKNIAIVCNPLAGNGRSIALAQKISGKLEERNICQKIFQEQWPKNFSEFTDVFIVGGDGTLNYFINHYPDIKLPLAIFNGGTGNDIHWMLYGEISFEKQLELVLSVLPKPVDAGRCNERLFINGAGIGFEGAVAKSLAGTKKLPGKTSFLITVLKKIFSYRSQFYRVVSKEVNLENKQLIIDVTNGQRAGGGFHIAPVAAVNDGWLYVVMIKAISPLMRLLYLPVIERGKHLHLSFIHHFQTKKISIESNQSIQSHLDGEVYQSNTLQIEILPARFLFRY